MPLATTTNKINKSHDLDQQSTRLNNRGGAPEEDLGQVPDSFKMSSRRCLCCCPRRSRLCSRIRQRLRLPSWLAIALYWLYTKLSGLATYLILFAAVYAVFWSIDSNTIALPECRVIDKPLRQQSQNNATSTSQLLECINGEALTVIVLYAFGFLLGEVMEFIHLPGLLGMLLGGMILRNVAYLLVSMDISRPGSNFTSPPTTPSVNSTSAATPTLWQMQLAGMLVANQIVSKHLRGLALTTILTRAGLGLDPSTLRRVAGSVFRLAFIPCFCEALVVTLVSRLLIGWDWSWAAMLGFVIAAASPAVIVPNMMRLEVTGWGVNKGIPTLVVAASSMDDVVAITGFGVALSMALSSSDDESIVMKLIHGPVEALAGTVFGIVVSVLLLFFPPPRLEHSHLIRGFLLLCLAIFGLMGSVNLKKPGAGALACLTLAFCVAAGWRSGLPWRITQPTSKPILPAPSTTMAPAFNTSANDGSRPHDDDVVGSLGPSSPPLGPRSITSSSSPAPQQPSSRRLSTSSARVQQRSEPDLAGGPRGRRRRNHDSSTSSSSVLHTLVEYPEHYFAILSQQYSPRQQQRQQHAQGGDLPSLAVAIAATGSPLATTSPPPPLISPTIGSSGGPPPSSQNRSYRPKTMRRFSLPEPTAHYELESFVSSSSGSNRGTVPVSPRMGSSSSFLAGTGKPRSTSKRKVFSPVSFHDPRGGGAVVDGKRPEEDDNDPYDQQQDDDFSRGTTLTQRRLSSTLPDIIEVEATNTSNVKEVAYARIEEEFAATPSEDEIKDGDDEGSLQPPRDAVSRRSASLRSYVPPGQVDDLLVTPQDRGMACLNSMRRTLAAVWFFVQPILFSLIGAEVNFSQMDFSSTGIGVACILIAVVARVLATIGAMLPSDLNMRERLFVGFSWLPKATVQAAIGPVALDNVRKSHPNDTKLLGWGEQVLTLAALSILITAPLGALLMPLTAPYLLHQDVSTTQMAVSHSGGSTDGTTTTRKRHSPAPAITQVDEVATASNETEPCQTQTTAL